MQAIMQIPVVLGAIQYSIAYMLLGGGFVGAAVIYVAAKAFGK